jgi:hypothetical protein
VDASVRDDIDAIVRGHGIVVADQERCAKYGHKKQSDEKTFHHSCPRALQVMIKIRVSNVAIHCGNFVTRK